MGWQILGRVRESISSLIWYSKMTTVERWCVYYDNATTFSSEDGTANDAPADGIQGIIEWRTNGTVQIHEGGDYYLWTGDCWTTGGLNDLERWLKRIVPELKYGRFIANAVFQQMRQDITGDSRQG